MMAAWIFEFVFYVLAVGLATWVSWHRPIAFVGITLTLCLLVTTAGYFGTSFASRVTLECIQAVVIIHASRVAFSVQPNIATAFLVAVSVMDLGFCAAIGVGYFDGPRRGVLYGNVTNLLFFLQCVAVGTPGIIDAYVGRGRHRATGGMVGRPDTALDALSDQVAKL